MPKLKYNLKKPVVGDESLIPRGNNKLTSLAAFYQKTIYRDTSYPVGEQFGPNPIDFIDDHKLLYGRVNQDGTPIFLAEDNLKQLHSDDNKTHFVLNFVADAYEDMRRYFLRAVSLNKIESKGTVFKDIPPARAWSSIHKAYHKYFDDLYLSFSGPYMNSTRNQNIKDFDSFLKSFLAFAASLSPIFPVTRTEYITSRYVSPSTSGLIVEIVEGVHDDDYAKYIGFIRDNNFRFFKKTAERFGFKVDKNAPWRLVADLGSPKMAEYMSEYGVDSVEDFFKTYYFSAPQMEIMVLKKYIWMFYDRYVVQSPGVATIYECPNVDRLAVSWQERARMSFEDMEQRYPDAYWLRVLVYLRAIETSQPWEQRKFEKVVRRAQEYEKYVDIDAACDYIDRQFRDKGSDVFVTRKDLTEEEIFDILSASNKKPCFRF